MTASIPAPLQTPRRPVASHTTPFKTPHRTPGEQTSQTPIVDFDLIEKQKENVQPSSRGRSAHSLSQTLGLKHKERAEELAVKRKEHEAKVSDDKLDESDDPLSVWEEYIDWVIESYPSGGTSADSGLVPLLEKATRSLKDDERYRDSYRYLRLWLLYSRNVDTPELVLNWLLANDVGSGCAALYEEAASLAESKGLYESADSLFSLGIGRSATPLPRLKRRYSEYQARILRNQSVPGSSSDVEGNSQLNYSQALARAMKESKRVTLGTKDERTGRSVHANSLRGGGQSAGLGHMSSSNTQGNNGRKLPVFRDGDGSANSTSLDKGPAMSDLGSRDVRRQENVKDAKAWTGERLQQKKGLGGGSSHAPLSRTTVKAPLKVFHDSDEDEDDDEGPRSPSKANVISLKPMLGSQHPEVDLLKKDPFRLWDGDVQASAKSLRGAELGSVTWTAARQSDRKGLSSRSSALSSKATKNEVRLPSSSSSSSKKTSEAKSARSSTNRTASSGPGSSSSRPSKPVPVAKRPERLVLPEALLYPVVDESSSRSSIASGSGSERSVEEVMARNGGWELNLDGDEERDPWGHLDTVISAPVISAHDQVGNESNASQDREDASRTPTRGDRSYTDVSRTPTQATESRSSSKPETSLPQASTANDVRPPSPTMMTKAAEEEVRALFNGADDDSDTSDASSEEDEDDSFSQRRPTSSLSVPTPIRPRHLDENAGARATPARSANFGPAVDVPRPLGELNHASAIRDSVAESPLPRLAEGVEELTPSHVGERTTAKESADLGEPKIYSKSTAQRIADEQEDEESDQEDADAMERHRYNFEEGHDLLEGGARYDQLTTISERTEYETRWGIATPARTRTVIHSPVSASQLDPANRGTDSAAVERSFASESSGRQSGGHLSHTGGTAHFQMSPGNTIQKSEEIKKDKESSPYGTVSDDAPSVCSPTDPEVIARILSALELPIESSPDFFDRSSSVSNRLASLQATRFLGTHNSSNAQTHTLDIDGNPFAVREKLGEGAYGSVYLAEDLNNSAPPRSKRFALGGLLGDASFNEGNAEDTDEDDDEDEDEAERRRMVAIKVESPANRWEFYILGQIRARLEERALQSIIGARRFYAYENESLLLLEWGEKGTLLEMVNNAASAGVAPAGSSGAGVEEVLAMFFTIELLRTVDSLHRAQLLHGDLKIDNCLLRLDEPQESTVWSNAYKSDGKDGWSSKGLYLVDFGRAIDLAAFPPSQRFIADWETDPRDCIEMREGESWTYEVDYHGVASVAYCLLFGRYIETAVLQSPSDKRHQSITGQLKRYWQVNLWSRLFDVCLNPRGPLLDRSLPIADELTILRHDMEQWLSENCNKGGKNLKGLLKKLEIWTMSRRS